MVIRSDGPIALDGLVELWTHTIGEPSVRVAVLDGPVDRGHPCLRKANLTELQTLVPGVAGTGAASRHGTAVASIIFGHDPAVRFQGVAPACAGLVLPIYGDDPSGARTACSQLDLARAIVQAVDYGALVINISGGQLSPAGTAHPFLQEAVRYSDSQGSLIIAPVGNDGCDCLQVPGALPSVLAVGAMDHDLEPLPISNWGAKYAGHGILAPGEDVFIALPGEGYGSGTGTSYAAALITGVVALLLSLQRQRGQAPSPARVRSALVDGAIPCELPGSERCRRLLTGRLDIRGALSRLNEGITAMSSATDTRQVTVAEPSTEAPEIGEISGIEPADCGCGCGKGASEPTIPAPSTPPTVQLVYALGTLGFDFASEARRDSIALHIGGASPAVAYDPGQLLKYLERNPWDAPAIHWTLNLDSTPIYVIQPRGAFAAQAYERLRTFLQEQLRDGVDRIALSGVIVGRARLISGQTLPVVLPDLRGLNNWNIAALVKASQAKGVRGAGKSPATAESEGLASFLERIYHGLRNLGTSPRDRAINYAATNAMNAAGVFESALKDRMQLDNIDVERSPICRPESDCWDVMLTFFDPENQLQRARKVHRFTVDVSDTVPVMVGGVRSWSVR